jgi:hypothetical protein
MRVAILDRIEVLVRVLNRLDFKNYPTRNQK